MSNMYWLVDKRVLVVTLTEPAGASDDDKAAYLLRTRDMIAQGIAPVFMVIDAREINTLVSPPTAKRIGSSIQQTNQAQGDNGPAWMVMVSESMVVRFAGSLFAQWSGGKMRAVSMLEEALDFLNSRDASLPPNMKLLLHAGSYR